MLDRLKTIRQRADLLTVSNYGSFRGWVRHMLAQLEWIVGRLDAATAIEPRRVHRLVFVCLGNINRSAFAEAVARAHGATTSSVGLSTSTGSPAFVTAISTARHLGFDLESHRTTDLDDYTYRAGDLLLAMEVRHVHRLRTAGMPADSIVLLGAWATPRRLHLHDPHKVTDAYFRTCFTLIESAVVNVIADLRAGRSVSVGG